MSKNSKVILLAVLAVALAAALLWLGSQPEAEALPEPAQTGTEPSTQTDAGSPTEMPTEAPTEALTEPPTEPPTVPPTEPPTEAPTEPEVFRNPLNGEILDQPYAGRIFAFPINNKVSNLPHGGTQEADILFEMYTHGYTTRCLALYTDITKVEAIGPVCSVRQNITDLCVAYDAFLGHANGSEPVMADLEASGIDNIWVSVSEEMAYRDIERRKKGHIIDSRLFVDGPGMYAYLQEQEPQLRLTAGEVDRDYGLSFTEDATPVQGEEAGQIRITFRIHDSTKLSTMTYDETMGRYVYTQYGRSEKKDEPENFENVFVMFAPVTTESIYHQADLIGSGNGYYACNGKIIPIRWVHENETDPITFTHTDGTPLVQGVGNSYIAIVPTASTVEWE